MDVAWTICSPRFDAEAISNALYAESDDQSLGYLEESGAHQFGARNFMGTGHMHTPNVRNLFNETSAYARQKR